ncbi:MAG: winged helix-turn-helix transcriptional regulator [Chloroflexi bacterium]|nr:winged helix-turn-helix transcriptional regulator [Chloroflexota bacterium]
MDEKTYSKYFKAFGDPTRLRILALLSAKEPTVNEIVGAVALSQPTVSRHLALLREAGVVIDRREVVIHGGHGV